MKFERVTITNFRQYYGEHKARFSKDSERNVTVFHGVNGAGKTSFFTALNWCLYGEGVEGIGQIISKEAVRQAEVNQEVIAKVVVYFIHDNQRYMASRQLRGIKQADGSIIERSDVDFVLMRTTHDGQSKPVPNPIGVMNKILPANVRTYFLFDGEKIDNFARPESAAQVRDAIYGVLNLAVLERARDHLSKVAKEQRVELRKTARGQLKTLVSQNEQLRNEYEQLGQQLLEKNEEIAATRRNIEDINQRLRETEAAQNLQKQYDLLTQQLDERESERKNTHTKLRDLASQGYLSLIDEALSKAHRILDEKRQRGEIPSNIRQQFVQDLLDRHLCICGRSFDEHDQAHQHLHRLLSSAVPSSLEDDVLNTSGSIRSLIDRSPEIRAELNETMRNKTHLDEAYDRLYATRDDIEKQMTGSNLGEASNLAKKREEYELDLQDYQETRVRLEHRIEGLQKQIEDLDKEIAKEKKSEVREQILSRKIDLAQSASDTIHTVYEQFAEEKRLEIEKHTRTIFSSLAWKGDHFHEIRLTPEYQLQVIDRWGQQARPELSAGERQVLSLSFIAAMASVAQREAPLVMDTPFGRLSSAHRESITARIPELTNQLILFVTDEELHNQALEHLRPRIGSEYSLHFDPTTSCTAIEEHSR